MADDKEKVFQDWLDRILQFPLPKNKMARVKVLAKELAQGVTEGYWDTDLYFNSYSLTPKYDAPTREESDDQQVAERYFGNREFSRLQQMGVQRVVLPRNRRLYEYFRQRWSAPFFGEFSEYTVMLSRGFLKNTLDSYGRVAGDQLAPAAFELLDEIDPANVFISYKRSESSAFALLILSRLKEIGLSPFVDMAIDPGANWKDFLKERIDASEYVVVLLGPKTLTSTMTLQEIAWAKQANKVIVPIWHNGFQYKASEWNLMPDLDDVLTNTHTIIVQNESAGGYNNALVELMNRFGYTP